MIMMRISVDESEARRVLFFQFVVVFRDLREGSHSHLSSRMRRHSLCGTPSRHTQDPDLVNETTVSPYHPYTDLFQLDYAI